MVIGTPRDARMDEYVRVIVFVCGPLMVLLLLVIVYICRREPTVAEFPEFKITITSVGAGEAFVSYHDQYGDSEFDAAIRKGSTFFKSQIFVQIPTEMQDAQVRTIVPRLADGLSKLGKEFVIFRYGELEPSPEKDQSAAIEQLRELEYEIQEAGETNGVERAKIIVKPGDHRKEPFSKVFDLMNQARNVRRKVEVLAQSKITRFENKKA